MQCFLQLCWAFCLQSDSYITWKEKNCTKPGSAQSREHISTAFHIISVLEKLSSLVLLCGVLREREREGWLFFPCLFSWGVEHEIAGLAAGM